MPRRENTRRAARSSTTRRPAQRGDPRRCAPGIGELTVVAGRIAGDVEAVAQRFGTAFSDSAARELRATIKNINTLTERSTAPSLEQSKNLDKIAVAAR